MDDITKLWLRNESDARAVHAGCWFDQVRAAYTVWWIESYCRLYEGDWAGAPMVLRGDHEFPDWELPISGPFFEADGETLAETGKQSLQRMRDYLDCYHAGRPVDWQYECTMRLFGWVEKSERWKRNIRRFQDGSIWVARKNKKSPTAAAIGLYLFAGDGEQGQTVYVAAKDGTQARIAMRHAFEMAKSSSELSGECKTNESTMGLAHLPTGSRMYPLSSGDARSQDSKEGLNGSLILDETHVVDAEFMGTLRRIGISRSEPFRLEFSSAGKNADGYGKQRHDYGREVEAGRVDNRRLFYAAYEAPQDLTDDQLAADPGRYFRMANPAAGHTVDEAEFVDDYKASKISTVDFARFKMDRLTIWVHGTVTWLRGSDWSACGQTFSESELASQACGAGIDLSITQDMSSLALAFPTDLDAWFAQVEKDKEAAEKDPDKPRTSCLDTPVRILNWYWLPEETYKEHASKLPPGFGRWVEEGWIKLLPGRVMNYAMFEDDVAEIMARYDVRLLCYDRRFATQPIQDLTARGAIAAEHAIDFPQSAKTFTGPATLWERLVISGKLWHNNNPVTTWQAGHVNVDRRRDKSILPIKPEKQTTKKIDGIVAGIMAIEAALRMPADSGCYYDSHELESV